MTMTNDERKALYALLSDIPQPMPSQAEDLARTLLLSNLDRLTTDIRKELERLEVERRQDADRATRMFYSFLAPMPNDGKPTLVNSTKDTDFYEQPQRQSFKVQVRYLKAFCKDHGLKESEMVKVGMGEIEHHRGWERTTGFGGPMELGQPHRKPREEVDTVKPADGHKEQRVLFRYAPKMIEWLPGQDK